MTAPEPVGLTDGERREVAWAFPGAQWLAPERESLIARIKADAYEAGRAAERAAHEVQVQAGDRLREAVEAVLIAYRYRGQAIPLPLADALDTLLRCRYGERPIRPAAPTPPQDAATEGGR